MSMPRHIHLVPSFHYDLAYLKTCDEYLKIAFRILDEALRLLERHAEYCYTVEQVFLLIAYWECRPEQREALQRFAREKRLVAAPGMYVMPDMNHPGGEALFQQVKFGKDWLQEHLGIEADVCWIADCWGHHAQLPQILAQSGYNYYVFTRCMRPDVTHSEFRWEGIDGTLINTHWLAVGYGNISFPALPPDTDAPDRQLISEVAERIAGVQARLAPYSPLEEMLLCNGGDFFFPQESSVQFARALNAEGELPPICFATPAEFLATVRWEEMPVVSGDFNSSLQGSFTANIAIKQQNRVLTNRLLALETLSVICGQPREYPEIWRLLLKQQFHDIICGTIADMPLEECLAEYRQAAEMLDDAFAALNTPDGAATVYNPLVVPRTEIVDGRLVELPPFGAAELATATPVTARPAMPLSASFVNDYYSAAIDSNGYITSLIEATSGEELVAANPAPFGCLTMQLDYGDNWLNFAAPLNGGSRESLYTLNHLDPFDRFDPNAIAYAGTVRPEICEAQMASYSDEEMVIEQRGQLVFWRLRVDFTTLVRFRRHSPYIEYETTIHPEGRHFRLRAAFPGAVQDGVFRHEIAFGIQERGPGEYPAQHWFDYADVRKGIGVLNAGTPGCGVDNGILLLTLFRSTAMEYKAPSIQSFNEGVPHTFRYAVLPHGADAGARLARAGQCFNTPPFVCATRPILAGWSVTPDNVLISALRWSNGKIFLRLYEAAGQPTTGTLTVPPAITAFTRANGLEYPIVDYQPCTGAISIDLRPFEIQGYLFTL